MNRNESNESNDDDVRHCHCHHLPSHTSDRRIMHAGNGMHIYIYILYIINLTHLCKDGVGGRSGFIEPIEEVVVSHVDEELGSSGFGTSWKQENGTRRAITKARHNQR